MTSFGPVEIFAGIEYRNCIQNISGYYVIFVKLKHILSSVALIGSALSCSTKRPLSYAIRRPDFNILRELEGTVDDEGPSGSMPITVGTVVSIELEEETGLPLTAAK